MILSIILSTIRSTLFLIFYEDYFADAGESDEKVIEKLGSPEELAENIRRELSEKQEKINGVKEEVFWWYCPLYCPL